MSQKGRKKRWGFPWWQGELLTLFREDGISVPLESGPCGVRDSLSHVLSCSLVLRPFVEARAAVHGLSSLVPGDQRKDS